MRPIKLKKEEEEEDKEAKKVYGINSRSDVLNASRPSTDYHNPKSHADYASDAEKEKILRQQEENHATGLQFANPADNQA